MKNVMCYLLIIVSLVFIIVPPVLRKFVPKQEDTSKDTYQLLTCTRDLEKISYSYKNNKPDKLNYTFSADSEDGVPYANLFKSCKSASDYDGDSGYLINGENSYCKVSLSGQAETIFDVSFRKNINSVKSLFEEEKFTCSIQEY